MHAAGTKAWGVGLTFCQSDQGILNRNQDPQPSNEIPWTAHTSSRCPQVRRALSKIRDIHACNTCHDTSNIRCIVPCNVKGSSFTAQQAQRTITSTAALFAYVFVFSSFNRQLSTILLHGSARACHHHLKSHLFLAAWLGSALQFLQLNAAHCTLQHVQTGHCRCVHQL